MCLSVIFQDLGVFFFFLILLLNPTKQYSPCNSSGSPYKHTSVAFQMKWIPEWIFYFCLVIIYYRYIICFAFEFNFSADGKILTDFGGRVWIILFPEKEIIKCLMYMFLVSYKLWFILTFSLKEKKKFK